MNSSNDVNNLKRIHIYVDANSWDEFVQFVQNKHGKTRGVLWYELKNAIDTYLKVQGGSKTVHNNIYSNYGITKSKTLRIVDAMGQAVMDMFKNGKTVSVQWIEEWLRLNISPATKTVSKYSDFFRKVYVWDMWENKYIKPWTFRRKDGKPLWRSEDEYLQWLKSNGISSVWVESKVKEEKEKIEELFEAEATD